MFHASKMMASGISLPLGNEQESQQLRSAMLICMELLGIHSLEFQYKVTVGNVARPDFLNFFRGRTGLFRFSYLFLIRNWRDTASGPAWVMTLALA